jgi:hypothetical protein
MFVHVTKDGQEMRLDEMETKHLVHVLDRIERTVHAAVRHLNRGVIPETLTINDHRIMEAVAAEMGFHHYQRELESRSKLQINDGHKNQQKGVVRSSRLQIEHLG